jgi:hypothetical protein
LAQAEAGDNTPIPARNLPCNVIGAEAALPAPASAVSSPVSRHPSHPGCGSMPEIEDNGIVVIA